MTAKIHLNGLFHIGVKPTGRADAHHYTPDMTYATDAAVEATFGEALVKGLRSGGRIEVTLDGTRAYWEDYFVRDRHAQARKGGVI